MKVEIYQHLVTDCKIQPEDIIFWDEILTH